MKYLIYIFQHFTQIFTKINNLNIRTFREVTKFFNIEFYIPRFLRFFFLSSNDRLCLPGAYARIKKHFLLRPQIYDGFTFPTAKNRITNSRRIKVNNKDAYLYISKLVRIKDTLVLDWYLYSIYLADIFFTSFIYKFFRIRGDYLCRFIIISHVFLSLICSHFLNKDSLF